MKKNPFVSVITVVKNNEKTIQRCIESVLAQDFKDYEYIIHDGESSDQTLNIIQSIQSEHINLYSEKDSSIYNAMNKAWRKAKGSYILFLNSDDYFYSSNSLNILVEKVKFYNLDFVCGNALVVKGEESWVWEHRTFTPYDFLCGNPCNHQSLLTKKEIFYELNGFNENYLYASDVLFMFQMIEKNFKGMCIEDIISVYSFTGASSVNQEAGISELEEIMKSYNKNIEPEKIPQIRRMLGERAFFDFELMKYVFDKIKDIPIINKNYFINDCFYLLEKFSIDYSKEILFNKMRTEEILEVSKKILITRWRTKEIMEVLTGIIFSRIYHKIASFLKRKKDS